MVIEKSEFRGSNRSHHSADTALHLRQKSIISSGPASCPACPASACACASYEGISGGEFGGVRFVSCYLRRARVFGASLRVQNAQGSVDNVSKMPSIVH